MFFLYLVYIYALCDIFCSLLKPDTLIVTVTCSEADIEKASFKIVTRVSIAFGLNDILTQPYWTNNFG